MFISNDDCFGINQLKAIEAAMANPDVYYQAM